MMFSRLFLTALLLASASVASAAPIVYNVFLSGSAESPPQISAGFGSATVIVDTALHTLLVDVSFSGLVGTTMASHIHSATPTAFTGTAGVATTTPTFAGFPLGVTSGHFVTTLDMTLASSYNPVYVTANGGTTTSAELALAAGIAAGKAYLNIHTTFAPGGEIRGFLVAAPEPATLAMAGAALLGFVALRRKR